MERRQALRALAGAAAVAALPAAARAADMTVRVWKNADCGCCGGWVEHMRRAGYALKVTEVVDTSAARTAAGIPARLGSCHTARVGGYALEGHVPAADVTRLLLERPDAVGLAVPGMPVGSPGMEDPGGRTERYDVLLVDRAGRTRVWSRRG